MTSNRMNCSLIGAILARGGSKSIPRKNLRLFNNKPLIEWSIKTALESDLDRIIVSTDDPEIRELAINLGAEAPFLRAPELAADDTPNEPVLLDILDYLDKKENYSIGGMALLQPTNPFRKIDDINTAIDKYRTSYASCIMSVTLAEANKNPEWIVKEDGKSKVTLSNGQSIKFAKPNRQSLTPAYIRNDFVYLFDPKNLYQTPPNIYGDNVVLFKMGPDRIEVDINNESEWALAELLHREFMTR